MSADLRADPLFESAVAPAAVIEGLSLRQLATRRLLQDKLTMIWVVVVGLFVLMAIAAPILSATKILDTTSFHDDLLDPALGGIPNAKGGLSWEHPLGVEPTTGRDVLARLVLGVSFSLVVALGATLVSLILGTVLGIISGYLGGRVDMVIGRLTDVTLAFPQTLMLIALSGPAIDQLAGWGLTGNIGNGVYIVLVLGLFGWPTFARLLRGQVLSQRQREYIEAAKMLGARNRRIYFRELLPNLWAPIIVYFTLTLPVYVSAEAALSFLGVGIKPPTPTLGNILTFSTNYSTGDFTFFFFPALFIAVLVLSFNLLGDGLRDALDPKANR
jgi:peptide/nickel transport system permease protein